MDRDAILTRVTDYYQDSLARHGCTARGADWSSASSQQARFDELLRLVDGQTGFSLLDYGCGYGALADYLHDRAGAGRYCQPPPSALYSRTAARTSSRWERTRPRSASKTWRSLSSTSR